MTITSAEFWTTSCAIHGVRQTPTKTGYNASLMRRVTSIWSRGAHQDQGPVPRFGPAKIDLAHRIAKHDGAVKLLSFPVSVQGRIEAV